MSLLVAYAVLKPGGLEQDWSRQSVLEKDYHTRGNKTPVLIYSFQLQKERFCLFQAASMELAI